MLGDEQGVFVVVEDGGVLVREGEHRRGLGADDRVALPHRLGEHRHIAVGNHAGRLEHACEIIGMPACVLIGGHEDADAVVAQHRDERFGELRIEMIGVGVDKVKNFLAGAAIG